MINLILTQVCNRQCRYCFAQDMLSQAAANGAQYMHRTLFLKALDLAERSRATEVRFLGGEPTLHPHFTEYAELAFERRLKVLVFSNGLIPRGPLEFLANCDSSQVGLLVNVNDEATYAPGEYQRLRERMKRLGDKVVCGYNISRKDFSLDPLLTLVDELGLRRNVRVGLAHPVISGQNQCLDWEDTPEVVSTLIEAARRADAQDILLGLDCGFTLCMFRDHYEDLINLRIDYRCCCDAVLDLTPDGKMWYCLALWGHPTSFDVDSFPDLQTFRARFAERFGVVRRVGFLDECPTCKFQRTGQCAGGCLSRTLRQWH